MAGRYDGGQSGTPNRNLGRVRNRVRAPQFQREKNRPVAAQRDLPITDDGSVTRGPHDGFAVREPVQAVGQPVAIADPPRLACSCAIATKRQPLKLGAEVAGFADEGQRGSVGRKSWIDVAGRAWRGPELADLAVLHRDELDETARAVECGNRDPL